jgi:hypothetical protein
MLSIVALFTAATQQPRSATARYEIEVIQTSDFDRTRVGGTPLRGAVSTSAQVTVIARDSAGGEVITLAFDSVRQVPTGAANLVHDTLATTHISGAVVSAFVRSGRVVGIPRTSEPRRVLAPFEEALIAFAAARRSAASSPTWADTVDESTVSPQGGGRSGSTVLRWTTRAGNVLEGVLTSSTVTDAAAPLRR